MGSNPTPVTMKNLLPVVSQLTYDSATQSLLETKGNFTVEMLDLIEKENPQISKLILAMVNDTAQGGKHRAVQIMLNGTLSIYKLLRNQAEADLMNGE